MGRRRRKRFSVRTGPRPPRGVAPRAAVDPPATDPMGPSPAASPKRQKRKLSNPSNDDKKRQKLDYAKDDVTSEIKAQEENQNDVMHDDVICRRSVATAKEDEEEEDGREEEVPILVTCNRNEGMLYLSKLRVVVNERCRKKCIRTGSTWWTPNEFQVVSGRGAAKDWKRTVKHGGQRLKSLLTGGVLCLTASPPKCLCRSCSQLTETGKKTDSPPNERREEVDDVATASEAADAVGDVKSRAKGEEVVKKPGLRMIRVHRRGKRHVNDTVDRKSGPQALPVKKKSRKSEPESDSNVASRDGRSRGRPRKSLVFRLSSASFEAVVCHRPAAAADDEDESGANRPGNSAPENAFEGRCSDRDACEKAVPSEALDDQTKSTDNIPNQSSTCKNSSDDVIADVTESFRREDSGAEISSSSRETKADGCLITGNDESASSSMTSFRCEKRAAKEPEEHASTRSAHAQPKTSPMVDIPEAISGDASSSADVTNGGSTKNPDRNLVTDRENDVTVAAVTSPSWSSSTSATSAPRRKSAHLDAVIAELKRKKRSREGVVPGAEQRSTVVGTLNAKLPATTCSDLMKMEVNVKTTTSLESVLCPLASASSSGLSPGPAFETSFVCSSDVKPICLNPTQTGDRTPNSESKAGLRREGRWKTTTAPPSDAPPTDHHSGWRKDDGSGSEVGRRFWMSSGGMTSDPITSSSSNSTLNFSQLASMYGLNAASPAMTSFPLPPTQMPFPFFPPYLFMGFPLQPLLPPPHFSSPSSSLSSGVPSSSGPETSLPVPVGSVSSAIPGSAPLHRKRRTQQFHKSPSSSSKESKSFPQMSSSYPGTDFGLRRTALSSTSSSSFSPSDLHLWRRMATDFSAHAWATGSTLAATGSSKPHSGSSTDRHPIWRPAVASQSASSREYVEATMHRTSAHAQNKVEVTSLAGASGNKNESSTPVDFTPKLYSGEKMEEADGFGGISRSSGTGKYSSECEGVLDLSKK